MVEYLYKTAKGVLFLSKDKIPQNAEENESFMYKLASFIVDKRNLFFLLWIFAIIFSFFSRNWVKVEDDLTTYLPDSTETRQGLTLMDDEFITYGSASVMVSNITYDKAESISDAIENIEGVSEVAFDDSEDHYKNSSALFSVTFDGEADDEISVNAMDGIKEMLSDYDFYVSGEVGVDTSSELAQEMNVVTLIAAVIIILVLTFTSRAYAEVPVLLITFVAAALINMGTNFLLGTISFVSNSVTIVLQLALAIDYAIILCDRFMEEHETLDAEEAVKVALSKAIPEISSSSLTTISSSSLTTVSGLIALAFMQFRIGADLAMVLIKAIMFSLLSVFTLMPGLIMLFSNLIDKSVHKNFVPKISAVGKFAFATKYVIPPVFVVLAIVGFIFSNQCPYCYGTSDLKTTRVSDKQIAEQKIKDNFGKTNLAALVVPAGDYESESKLINRLSNYEEVDSVMGLANIEAMDGYVLTDKLTPTQYTELVGLD